MREELHSVGKVHKLCRVKTYSNSRVLGHGQFILSHTIWSVSGGLNYTMLMLIFNQNQVKIVKLVVRMFGQQMRSGTGEGYVKDARRTVRLGLSWIVRMTENTLYA